MAAMSQIVIAAEEGEGGGLELLLPATPELIAGIIAFGIVFFFIWRFAGPAINRTLEQRQAAITGRLEAAEQAKREAESLLADYKAQLAESRAEGNRIIEEARTQAEQIRTETVARANEEATQILAKAREEADAEKARALAEARREVGVLSVSLAEKIVGGSLDDKIQQELIERYIAELERL